MLGWLHCVPKDKEQARMHSETWPLPDCEPFNYIVEWFLALRLDFGYQDIKAWSDLHQIDLESWEVDQLISMTGDYMQSTIKYRAPEFDIHPPYDGRSAKQRQSSIASKFKAAMRKQNAD